MGSEQSRIEEKRKKKRSEKLRKLYGELENALRFSRDNKLKLCNNCIEFCKSSYDCFISRRYIKARDYLRDVNSCVSKFHSKLFPDHLKNLSKLINQIDDLLILYTPPPRRSSVSSSSLSLSS